MFSTVVKYSSTEKEIYIKIIYSHPKIEDLNEIMKIENSGFSEEKAATEESMKERIEKIADTFILAYNEKQQPIGYIVGPATDERYISDEFEYCGQNEPPVRSLEPVSAEDGTSQCGEKSH